MRERVRVRERMRVRVYVCVFVRVRACVCRQDARTQQSSQTTASFTLGEGLLYQSSFISYLFYIIPLLYASLLYASLLYASLLYASVLVLLSSHVTHF